MTFLPNNCLVSQKDIPADTFAAGLPVDVGDMIDLLAKDNGAYEVRRGRRERGGLSAREMVSQPASAMLSSNLII